jgi:hypothetical protein
VTAFMTGRCAGAGGPRSGLPAVGVAPLDAPAGSHNKTTNYGRAQEAAGPAASAEAVRPRQRP